MRQINLNGTFYEIQGDIIKRAVSPWMAKVSSGSKEYSDFSQAALEEYHDFRNGIGKERGGGSLARLKFSEGIDFTTEGKVVLGPLVTTAGTFGVAPVKIIDFQGATYAIGSDGTIQKWNTLASEWEHVQYVVLENCEDVWDLFQHGNATHALDASDYKVGSGAEKITVNSTTVGEVLALETITSVDLTAYTRIRAWIKSQLATSSGDLQMLLCSAAGWTSPTGGSGTNWTYPERAYDDQVGSGSSTAAYRLSIPAQTWSEYLELTHAGVSGIQLRYHVNADTDSDITKIDIDIYHDSAWHDVYEGSFTENEWITKALPDASVLKTITKVRIRFWNNHASSAKSAYLTEFDFDSSTVETIDVPALTADTWTRIVEDIPDPSNLATTTRVGIKSVTDLGTEPYIIRIDDLQAEKEAAILASIIDAIVATDTTDEYFVVSSAMAAKYSADAITWSALDAKCMGYLAFYDTKLRALDTDGGTLHSSPANDIDGTWTEFNLTGHFGTVYDLFEGKLLADGTPTLYFCGTEGLFTIDVANEKAYKQEVEYPPLTYAGHVGKYWNANVWVSTGYGILKVTPSMATFVGPDLDDGLPSTYQGWIYDMVTVNNWLVYCVNKRSSSDKSSILKRNASYGGNLQVYTSAADTAITCLHHSPSSLYTNGRLWFGEGTSVKYMMFPDTTSNVKQISTYQYVDDSGYGYLPIFRKLAAISKVALGVAAITKSCDANEYIELWYQLNGAGSWTDLGDFNDSPRDDILTFGSGLGTEFYTIQFRIKLKRGTTNTNSPELESLLFYYLPRPATINAWTFNVVCMEDDAEALIAALEVIRDTKTLVAFYPTGDTGKTSYNVALSTMPMRFYVENQQTRQGTIQVTVEQIFNG